MATEQDKAAVRRWFVDGARDSSVFDQVLAPNVVMHVGGMPEPLRGVEEVKGLQKMMSSAFPDLNLTVDEMVDQGDTITVQWSGKGTHAGELRAPNGMTIPPTGKRVTFNATDIVRVADGKIVDDQSGFDIPGLLGQLGPRIAR